MESKKVDQGLKWQIGIWDEISELYVQETDRRFEPVVEAVIARGALRPGERVLDLGTGTGSVAVHAAKVVGGAGSVIGIDISSDMLDLANRRVMDLGLRNVEFREGRAEDIPAQDSTFDAVLASLSLMYVIDRAAAARELARVLRPGGRLVAAVWASSDECDIVTFQQAAGSFAPTPPVPGVGPGALADTTEFLGQLSRAGIKAQVERQRLGFDFDDFELAWDVLAGVTTAQLAVEVQEQAKKAVRDLMWNGTNGPRHFRNTTQFIVGHA